MNEETQALEANQTWRLVPLPPNKHTIGCRWVYKVKYKADDSVERYKARVVAKGYTQQASLGFVKSFSLVTKLTLVRILLALVAHKDWHLAQLDFNNAFLNGELFEEIYMDMPQGYKVEWDNML